MPIWPHASDRGILKPKPRCAGAWRLASGSMVCGICVRRLPPTISLQQVLLKVLETLRSCGVRDTGKLPHFVLGMSRMMVVDQRRTAHRQERIRATFASDLIPAPAPEPPIDSGQLARCVQALKERERSVVVHTFYDDHTAAEVGAFLGISEANVRVIRHRAIRQLRTCMESIS